MPNTPRCTDPVRFSVHFSALLAAYEADAYSFYLCNKIKDVCEEFCKQLPPEHPLHNTRPFIETKRVHAAFLRVMPHHIKPWLDDHFIGLWLQNLPFSFHWKELISWPWLQPKSGRSFRIAVLRWAIQQYKDPELTLYLQ